MNAAVGGASWTGWGQARLSRVLTLRRYQRAANRRGFWGDELLLFRLRRRIEGRRADLRRGRARGAPLGVARRRRYRRRGRGFVRAEPLGERERARMGRFL